MRRAAGTAEGLLVERVVQVGAYTSTNIAVEATSL
jgi:hypothetical protein